ncbi:MAG: hypothetical protein JJE09_12940 [Bacteroidia bacterium]|nr:hypothetical protein [Bacteroidia bacterium]
MRWRTDLALKKNKSLRASLPYKQAKNIGIIFTVEDKQKHLDIKDLIHHFESDGKLVKVLEFLPKKKENYEFLFDFFSIDDLSFWGSINSSTAEKFSDTAFDYLLCVDNQSNPLLLNLLARCKARCRVGKFSENETAFFELMIESKGTTRGLIDHMYKYTKQLK